MVVKSLSVEKIANDLSVIKVDDEPMETVQPKRYDKKFTPQNLLFGIAVLLILFSQREIQVKVFKNGKEGCIRFIKFHTFNEMCFYSFQSSNASNFHQFEMVALKRRN